MLEATDVNVPNMLVVAFIAGHRFCMQCHPFRYQLSRLEGYHLYFHAGFWGLILTLGATFAVFLLTEGGGLDLARCGNLPTCILSAYAGFMASAAGVISVLLVLLLPDLIARLWNWTWYNSDAARTALLHRHIRDGSLEKLLLDAHESGNPVMVTLDTRAVYAGYVVCKPDPTQPAEHLRIMPVCSGYRQSESQEVVFKHNYTLLVELARKADPAVGGASPTDFIVSFPIYRVASARVFNPSVYSLINPPEPSAHQPDSPHWP